MKRWLQWLENPWQPSPSLQTRLSVLDSLWLFHFAILLTAVTLALTATRVIDPDTLYHLGHSRVYAEHGPLYREFPWAAFSVISQYRSDLWWGLHLLYIPFGLLPDPEQTLRYAPILSIFANMTICGIALRKLNLNHWWVFLMLFGSAIMAVRCLVIRPQAFSAALMVLAMVCLLKNHRRDFWITCALIGFLHSTLSYMLLMVGLAAMVVKKFDRSRSHQHISLGLVASGVVLAAIYACIRPGAIDGLHLMKIQLIDLFVVKRQNIIQNFGIELNAGDATFAKFYILPLVLLMAGGMFASRRKAPVKPELVGTLVVVALSVALIFGITKRGIDQFAPFAALSCVLLITNLERFRLVMTLASASVVCYGIGTYFDVMGRERKMVKARPAVEWLAKNTPENSVIFHPVWSQFPELFYFNRHNRYLGGMDPIFQYALSPSNYWYMTVNHPDRTVGFTGPKKPTKGSTKGEEPIEIAIPREFGAKFLYLPVAWSPSLIKYCRNKRSAFKKRFEDGHAVIFEVIR